jgi:hypothetical protein|nr:MAG TPA: hypothetical protein [Caudoviricetes sp.]
MLGDVDLRVKRLLPLFVWPFDLFVCWDLFGLHTFLQQ